MRLRFLKPILILTLILAALLAWPLIAWLEQIRTEVFAAWGVGLGNAVIGLLIIELTLLKDSTTFMAAYFGGMAIRIVLTLALYALMLTNGFDPKGLTFFMMGFYFVYVVIEIRFMISVLSQQKAGSQRA